MKKISSAFAALTVGLALAVGSGGLASFADEPVPDDTTLENVSLFGVNHNNDDDDDDDHERLAICHSGSGKNWTFISPDANGYNGHKNHSADIYGLTEGECLAKNDDGDEGDGEEEPPTQEPGVVTEWHTWIVSEVYTANPQNADDVAWPQTYLGAGQLVAPTCDTWVQQDHYQGTRAQIDAVTADGILERNGDWYEDGAIGMGQWVFVYSGACETPPPAAEVCTVTGDWYTEHDDLAPVLTEGGLAFESAAQAVGYRLPVTGNLQGLTNASVDADANGADFYIRLVVDLSGDGGPAYKSLSFPGVSTVGQSSVSHQFPGQTVADLAVTYPNNKITSIGFQTSSNSAGAGTAVLRSAMFDCGEFNFVPEKPVTPEPKVEVTYTEWEGAEPTCDTQEAVWVREKTTVTTVYEVVFQEGVYVTLVDEDASSSATVKESKTVVWDGADCVVPPTTEPPVTTPPVVAPPTGDRLAYTGAEDVVPWVIAGVMALLAGLLLVSNTRRNRN